MAEEEDKFLQREKWRDSIVEEDRQIEIMDVI